MLALLCQSLYPLREWFFLTIKCSEGKFVRALQQWNVDGSKIEKAALRRLSVLMNATLEEITAPRTRAGDSVNLEADNGSRGCRTPHERALPFKHRSRARSWDPLRQGKIGGKAPSVAGERKVAEGREGKKKHGTKTDVRPQEGYPTLFGSARFLLTVPTRSSTPEIDP